ncbi:hypothetical protein DAMA08_042940 [Martiniozyma asiatica (nom. inval.)]|nr:hypothetical protein DAMA08_042940 [Martiniozyma asiatica]
MDTEQPEKRKRGRPRKNKLTGKATTASETVKSPHDFLNASQFEKIYLNEKNPISLYGASRSTNNFDMRSLHFHGLRDEFVETLHKIWQKDFDSGILPVNGELDHSNKIQLPSIDDIKIHPSSKEAFQKIGLKGTIKFDNTEMIVGSMKHFPITDSFRRGVVINTGGLPLVMKWCPLHIGNKKYLFVNVVPNLEGKSVVSRIAEAEFNYNRQSTLLIYECSFTGEESSCIKLKKRIILPHSIKEMHFLQQSPIEDETLMIYVDSNGSVQVWKINHELLTSKDIYTTVTPSMILKTVNPITTATFTSPSTILCGCSYGLLAHFTIPNLEADFVLPTRLSTITAIQSSYPTEPSTTLLATTDFTCYMLPTPSPSSSPLLPPTLTECGSLRDLLFHPRLLYNPQIEAFTLSEWPVILRLMTARDPVSSQRAKIPSGEVWSLGSSPSGLVTIGMTNGTLALINWWNWLASEDRKQIPGCLILYRLTKSKDQWNLDLNYKIEDSKGAANEGIRKKQKSSREVRKINLNEECVLGCGMEEGIVGCVWGNGMLVIEELIY